MNAIIHLVKNEDLLNNLDNFHHNKNFYLIKFKHFVITDIKSPQKFLFKDIEQIFYTKKIEPFFIFSVLKMLKELDYTNVILNVNDKKEDIPKNLNNLDEILNQFAVVNNFVNP